MADVRWSEAGVRTAWRKTGLLITAMCLTGALAACGGDSEDTAAIAENPSANSLGNPPANTPAGNQAPTIGGTPTTQVMPGQPYSFSPTANDPNGDALTFVITNAPSWAAFDSSTGALSGTPTAAQVGTYGDITIGVSDGSASTSLATFSIQVVATAGGSMALRWAPPTENTDGTPLTDLAGYKVHWGPAEGTYTNSVTINNPGLSSYVVEQLTPATWYFTVTAINSDGAESGHSNVASKHVL